MTAFSSSSASEPTGSVEWVGSGVADALQTASAGRVHSVFAHACNLLLDNGRMLALLYPELPRTPWCLRLAEETPGMGFRPMTELLSQGEPFRLHVQPAEIEFPDSLVRVSCAKARLWDASLPDQAGAEPFSPSASCVALLTEMLPHTDGRDFGTDTNYYGNHGGDLNALMTSRLQEGLALLRLAMRPRAEQALCKAALNLMGLGPGLTPAGDDMLVGALAALTLAAPANPAATSLLESLRGCVSTQATERTSSVAAVFMIHACAGLFAENVLNVLLALQEPRSGSDLHDAAQQLLAFGATSGADTLRGIMCVLTSPLFLD